MTEQEQPEPDPDGARCPSCGVLYIHHLGLHGTCAKLSQLRDKSYALAIAAETALDCVVELGGVMAWKNGHPATQGDYDEIKATELGLRNALNAYKDAP